MDILVLLTGLLPLILLILVYYPNWGDNSWIDKLNYRALRKLASINGIKQKVNGRDLRKLELIASIKHYLN